MLAKLVVTGATRTQALERARRALAEFDVDGVPTVLPFHRAVVNDPAFAPADPAEAFSVHTRWIETEFAGGLEPWAGGDPDGGDPPARQTVVVEVAGKRLEVSLPAGLVASGGDPSGRRPPKRRAGGSSTATSGDAVTSPMQGTIVKIAVAEEQAVAEGDLIVVLEAMKMEQPLTAHKAGVVTGLTAEVGQTVGSGAILCELKDP
jgi:acetyl-CoA/propionyl-CoA carboxylase biotin carboxyl carrier protein